MMYRTTNCLKLDSSESAQPQYVGLKEQLHYLNTTDTLKPVVPADIGNLEKQLFDSIIVRPDSSLCATYINYCSGLDSIHEIRIRKIDNDYKAYHEVVVASPGFKIRECEKYCTAVKNGEIPGYFYKTVFRKLENLSAQIVFQSCDSVAYAKYLEKYPMCSRSIRSGMQARLKELSDLNHAITIDTYSAYQKFIQEFGSTSCRDLQIRIFGRNFETLVMEEEEKFHLAGGHFACVGLVGKSARLAAETILQLPRR